MTTAGWIMMIVSLGIVWSAAIWAYRKVLRIPRARPDREDGSA